MAYRYKGVQYSAIECIFEDGFDENPWCATAPNIVNDSQYTGQAGATGSNWDYCSCSEYSFGLLILYMYFNIKLQHLVVLL